MIEVTALNALERMGGGGGVQTYGFPKPVHGVRSCGFLLRVNRAPVSDTFSIRLLQDPITNSVMYAQEKQICILERATKFTGST